MGPEIVCRHVKPKWLIDVGVGCGDEARQFRVYVPEIKIVGLEPHPDLYSKTIVDYPGALLQQGAWSHARMILLSREGKQSTCYRDGEIEIEVRPLDELLRQFPKICEAVLWLDIEGAELEALQGGRELLKRCVAVNAETRERRKYPRSCCMSEVDAFLASFGFCKVTTYNYCGGDDPHEDAVYVRV